MRELQNEQINYNDWENKPYNSLFLINETLVQLGHDPNECILVERQKKIMTEIEKAAMLLRRALSEKELAGEIKDSDAIRLIESIQEAERLLVK